MKQFCDKRPCPLLIKLIDTGLLVEYPKMPMAMVVSRHHENPSPMTKLVNLHYCPFCGTRIDEDVIVWAKARRGMGVS